MEPPSDVIIEMVTTASQACQSLKHLEKVLITCEGKNNGHVKWLWLLRSDCSACSDSKIVLHF